MNKRCFAILGMLFIAGSLTCARAQTWESVPIGTDALIIDIKYDKANDRIVLLAGDEFDGYYLHTSDAEGANWIGYPMPREIDEGMTSFTDMALAQNGRIFVPTTIGIYYSDDAGASWNKIDNVMNSSHQSAIAYNEHLGLLVGDEGLYYYNFSLDEYTLLDNSLPDERVWAIITLDSLVAVSFSSDVLISKDLGMGWISAVDNPALYSAVYPLTYEPIYSTIFYNTITDTLFAYDINTRKRHFIVLDGAAFSLTLSASSATFAGHVIICRTDGFNHILYIWEYVNATGELNKYNVSGLDANNVWSVECMIDPHGVLYVATNNGLYRTTEPIATSAPTTAEPPEFSLSSTYPNPVASGTPVTVRYTLERASQLTLIVRDVLGRVVSEQSLGAHAPGEHTHAINTAGLRPGLYFYTLLRASGTAMNGKMVVGRER